MEILRIVLIVLEVIASIALTAVVLLQSGKEAGLSGAIAGGNTDTYLGKNSKAGGLDKKLAASTKWIALAWILLALALSFV
jgi:preprotein translocase subunit SecG